MKTASGKQLCLNSYSRLGLLRFEDSLLLRNNIKWLEVLQYLHGRKCSVSTLGVKDLYYSFPQSFVLARLRIPLERDLVSFQFCSGIAVPDCSLW